MMSIREFRRFVSIILMFFASHQLLFGQTDQNFPPPEQPEVIRAVKASEKINIDGLLDEPEWRKAPVIKNFFKIEPRQGGKYLYPTEVRLLYDDKNIYVGAYCQDSLGRKGVRVQDLRRDFIWGENDVFGIQLDPQNLKQYCVSFQTTPYSNQRDLQVFNDNNIDNDWDALWSVRTQMTDSGYFAEFAIPFKTIRYDRPQDIDSVVWGITFLRLARREYEFTVFPAIPQSFTPYRMTYAAELHGLEVPEASANIRVEPYTLYQFDRGNDQGAENFQHQAKLGGDVKWALSPNAVLDVTFNTDFAQADVDRAVNNLERFNILFPERRQFFLENSGIWAGASNRFFKPFFSRSIGLQGTFNAEPARINAGSRYTFRNEKQAIAGLLVHQAETANSPAASFAVGRYIRNYGNENNVGLMITNRINESSPKLNFNTNHNTTITLDGLIRPRDELTLTYMLSSTVGGNSDTLGLAGNFTAGYVTNKFYAGWVTNFVSSNYNPEMGFVSQQNVIWHNPGGYYIWRPKSIPWIRRFDPGVFFNYYHDASNPRNFQQGNIYLFPIYTIFTNGSFLEYAIFPTWQNINFEFAPLGLRIGEENYYYTRQHIRFNTDQSAKLSGSANFNWGGFYNGQRETLNLGLRFAYAVHAAFTLDYEFNRLRNIGTENENLKTHLTTGGVRFALNPRLQLSAFYQYNSFDQRGRWNIRTSWEYRPLSFVYLVFNETHINTLDQAFQEQQFIGKLTFIHQF